MNENDASLKCVLFLPNLVKVLFALTLIPTGKIVLHYIAHLYLTCMSLKADLLNVYFFVPYATTNMLFSHYFLNFHNLNELINFIGLEITMDFVFLLVYYRSSNRKSTHQCTSCILVKRKDSVYMVYVPQSDILTRSRCPI